jgi:hypothetical protein
MAQATETNQANNVLREWKVLAVVGVLCLAFFLNGLNDAARNSAVADEVGGHIAAGYLYWTTGTYSGGIANFPLGQLLSAMPVALLGRRHELFTEQHLVLFRLSNLILGLLMGIILYRFARGIYGRKAAIGGLFLFAFSPNIIAHSSLATLDLPIAFFVFLTFYALWRYVRRPHWLSMLGLSLALACAFATKVQAVLLLPLILIALAVSLRSNLRRHRWRRTHLWSWVLLLVIPWLFVNAVYLNFPFISGRLLPSIFVSALRVKLSHVQYAQPGYLMGQYSSQGWWYYFPFAILVKTPVPTLILAALGLILKPSRKTLLFVILPSLAFLGMAALSDLNIGLRHVLMVYPFMFMLAGKGISTLWGRSWRGALVVILGGAYLVQAVMIAPHHLSYFNLVAGGPRDGHRLLIDSNYDWGQNDDFLREYIEERGADFKINPDPFHPTTGNILVNANALYGIYGSGEEAAYAWLKQLSPANQIAYTWFEYHLPDTSQVARELASFEAPFMQPDRMFRPWDVRLEPRQRDEALRAVGAHLNAVSRRHAEIGDQQFRLLLALALTASASYGGALDEVRSMISEDPNFQPALCLGGEIMVRWKLGILKFSGDEYLTGSRSRPAATGTSPPDADEVAEPARLAGLNIQVSLVHGALGQALIRLGRVAEGREHLAIARSLAQP